MDFRRINEKTVRCVVSHEEMAAYGLEIEDFFNDREKSRAFLESVVEQAHEEVGYEVTGSMISMQLMRLPNKDLAITFTEGREDNIIDMLQYIRNIIGGNENSIIDEIFQRMHAMSAGEKAEAMQKLIETCEEGINGEEKKEQVYRPSKRPQYISIFAFENLAEVEELAGQLGEEYKINNRLFKDEVEGTYYLVIKKGRLSMDNYNIVRTTALEYGTLVSDETGFMKYVEEHYQAVIKKDALSVLRSL